MHFQFLPNAPVDAADIIVIPAPLEATVCFRGGTAKGPAAIFEASENLEYYEEHVGWSPFKHLEICVLEQVSSLPSETLESYHARLRSVATSLPPNALIILLGGEHSITPPVVASRLPIEGHVVFLDAHADFRDSYRGSKLSHACTAKRLVEAGFGLTMIGARSFFESEPEAIASNPSIVSFPDTVIQERRGFAGLLEHLGQLEGPVWVSVDMDVFDPSAVPDVGTPQPGGLSWYQVDEIMASVASNQKVDIMGLDITELAPSASPNSAVVAAKLMQRFISRWAHGRGGERLPMTGVQSRIDYE